MRAVVQRVKETSLKVDGNLISQIPFGLIIYFGVKKGDDTQKADYLAGKISRLRVFEDENGKMNKSVLDVGGEIMCVSQFTLYADVSHGNRPGFTDAEVPEKAVILYDYFCEKLKTFGVTVKKGVFGADMKILELSNGPVTIIYDV